MKIPRISSTLGIVGSRSRSWLDCDFFSTTQTVRCYISALGQALEKDSKLWVSMFVHLILVYNIYEYLLIF